MCEILIFLPKGIPHALSIITKKELCFPLSMKDYLKPYGLLINEVLITGSCVSGNK